MHLSSLRHPRMRRGVAIAFAAAFAASAVTATAAIPPSERDVLIALYTSTGGPSWIRSEHWNGPPGTECTWEGILCDEAGEHVIRIDADSNNLTGQLPPLAALTELQYFAANYNHLTGPVPPLVELHHLILFDADTNHFSGPLPSFAGLDNLASISLGHNDFTGTIPELDLPALTLLSLGPNHLTGTLPSFTHVPNLALLSVVSNELTGAIPPLAGFVHLMYFNFGGNHFTGHLPPAPMQVDPAGSRVCPNELTPDPDPDWDAITGQSPWFIGCNGTHLNLDQAGISGTWYDYRTPGQGFVLSALPDQNGAGHGVLFGGWFTFIPQATPDPTGPHWFSVQGDVDTEQTEVEIGLYETLGGNFAAPPSPTTRRVGTIDIKLIDCFHGLLGYHFDDGRVRDNVLNLHRLTANANCTLEGDTPLPADNSRLSGAWYDPEHSGQGLVVDLVPTQNTLFAAWYTFAEGADAGDPMLGQRWYYMQAANVAPSATTMRNVPIYAPADGVFDFQRLAEDQLVGSADFEFDGCDALTVTYAFDPPGPTGTLHLVRLGSAPAGCKGGDP